MRSTALAVAALVLGSLGCQSAPPLPAPDSPAGRLHQDALVADLHADPTLWNDDLLAVGDRQATLPSLIAGGVDAVVFGIPTQGLPILGGWWPFTLYRGYPRAARTSAWAAAQHQIGAIEAAAAASGGRLRVCQGASDLRAAQAAGAVCGFIGVEGGHAIEGDLSRLSELADRGVLYLGPVHLSDNDLGGSSYALGPIGPGEGLTPLGRQVVAELGRLGIVVDLAHASRQTFFEILDATPGPVMVSHTGVSAVHESWRNLDDAQLRAVAARGGVVGIMFGKHYLGDARLSTWVDHVAHAVEVMGAEHVAIGTDLDGMVPLPDGVETAADLSRLTQALLDRGFSESQVRLVLGGSFSAFLERVRP